MHDLLRGEHQLLLLSLEELDELSLVLPYLLRAVELGLKVLVLLDHGLKSLLELLKALIELEYSLPVRIVDLKYLLMRVEKLSHLGRSLALLLRASRCSLLARLHHLY